MQGNTFLIMYVYECRYVKLLKHLPYMHAMHVLYNSNVFIQTKLKSVLHHYPPSSVWSRNRINTESYDPSVWLCRLLEPSFYAEPSAESFKLITSYDIIKGWQSFHHYKQLLYLRCRNWFKTIDTLSFESLCLTVINNMMLNLN